MQDLRAKNRAQRSKDHRDPGCEKRSVKNIVSHLIQLACTKILCNGHTESGTASHAKAQYQKLDTAAGSNACQGLRPQDLTYNSCINNVVSLLKKISYQQRKSELEHQLQRISLGHGC